MFVFYDIDFKENEKRKVQGNLRIVWTKKYDQNQMSIIDIK